MSRVRRRQFLIATGALLAAPFAGAQQAAKTRILGVLGVGPRPTPEERARSPLIARLRQLGWIEGQNLVFESFWAEGREDRLPELAAQLIAKRPDVIWMSNPETAVAAAGATKTIPIVFWGVPYPVEQGLVDSYARPGRNITGLAFQAGDEYMGKQLELLRELAPGIKRLAWLVYLRPQRTLAGGTYRASGDVIGSAARTLGIELRRHFIDKREDFDVAFKAIVDSRAQAIVASMNQLTYQYRQLLAEFALRNRLPSASTNTVFVEAGCLVSYGPDFVAMMVQSMSYVDKILRGAKPAELPVEMPNRYDLAINLKTAKAIGIKVPQSILVRANKVIE